jgi:hypothetical protein
MLQISKFIVLSGLALICIWAKPSHAYEYQLQFTPVGNYENLVVAGYQIVNRTVIGNCSYIRITAGSGRDPRPGYVPYPQTCTWDLYGNLLSIASGAPAVPAPIATVGTETIYARVSAGLYTGSDSALRGGFVFTRGAHYNWQTPATYTVLPNNQPYTLTTALLSNGDIPLNVIAVHAGATAGIVKVDSTTCIGIIAVGTTCDITVTLDPSKLTSTTGLAYSTLTIKPASNAGEKTPFVQSFTIVVPIPPDDGG